MFSDFITSEQCFEVRFSPKTIFIKNIYFSYPITLVGL
jgi:hypothetical protein